MTRRIQSVLAGLAEVRVDQTTEGQLLKTVPSLVRVGRDLGTGPNVERHYRVYITNDGGGRGMLRAMWWVPQFFFSIWPPHEGQPPIQNKWAAMSFPFRVAYVLGWRHLSFGASVTVLDGVVSSILYDLEPDVFLGWPAANFVFVRSVHGFWRNRGLAVPVQSTDDQNADFRFGGLAGEFSWLAAGDATIGVAYTMNAPRESVSHAFRVDLTCFWSLGGCDSVRQVVPLLWADRLAIIASTAARLTPQNPCPDQILAGRVRTLPDLNVVLLEAVNSKSEELNYEGDRTHEIVTDYRLREVLRGHPDGPGWTGIHYRQTIPWSSAPGGAIANPVGPSYPKLGDRFLYFSGARFDSCRMVPATPSAQSAVRTAVPAQRREEDDIEWMWGRS